MIPVVDIPGYPGHMGGPNGPVTRVVIHATVSPCEPGGARGNASYFQSAASGGLAHYVADPAEIVRCCQEDTWCWHAPPNPGSIGVELCDPQAGDPARWADGPHQAMLRLAAQLVADICDRHGIPKRRIGPADLLAGATGICGHVDVTDAWRQSDHTDPDVAGPFPWDQLIALVNGGQAAGGTDVPAPTDWVRHLDIGGGHYYHLRADGSVAASPGAPFVNYVALASDGNLYAFGPSRNGGVFAYPGLPAAARQGDRYFTDFWLG